MLRNLGALVLTLYGALVVFVLVALVPVALIARVPIRLFWHYVKEPYLIAFSTASSEAALPLAMENMEKMGVPKRIVAFVLPTGYSFNLDGSTLYLSIASVFVAQAAGIQLTLGTQLVMMLTLMLTSKGVAGVPRAALVVLSGTLASFGLPLRGRCGDSRGRRVHGHGADIGKRAGQLPGVGGDGPLGGCVRAGGAAVIAGSVIVMRIRGMAWTAVAAFAVSSCGSNSPTGGGGGVTPTVAAVTIAGAGALVPGQTEQLTGTARDASGSAIAGETITWSSAPAGVATVSSGGLVTAVATGTATITASAGGIDGTASVTVRDGGFVGPAGGSVTAASGAVMLTIPAQALASGTAITVATDAAAGSTGGAINGTAFDIGPANTSFASPATLTIHYQPGAVTAGVDPSNLRLQRYSGGSWAPVAGSTVNTGAAEVMGGITSGGTYGVVPIPAPVATIAVAGPGGSLLVGDSAQLVDTLRDAQGNVLSGRTVSWTSSATAVATVSASGVVVGVAAGTATITATSEGVSGSIDVTVVDGESLTEQHVLAQQGLAIALASTVLQSQILTLLSVDDNDFSCQLSDGGGSYRLLSGGSGASGSAVGIYFDNFCTRPYMMENVSEFDNPSASRFHLVAMAAYTGPTGTALGSISFNEDAYFPSFDPFNGTVNGLGTYTPVGGGTTVSLGLNCDFGDTTATPVVCQGGIAQDFPGLGKSLGSVATLGLDTTAAQGITFAGSSILTSGAVGALSLTAPSTLSLVVQGGSAYGTGYASGAAATFSLFPPTPTGWSVADSAHDQVFAITVADNAVRNLTGTIKRISTGATLATLALDQSGTGTITWSDGTTAAVTSWMLSQ